MLTPILRTVLYVLVAGTLGLQLAHADIYTWADSSGVINVSNLSPPDGVRVISVARALPESAVAREIAARDAARRAETQALEERVRQLESEAVARRQPPTQVIYPPILATPPMQYWSEPAPSSVQYVSIAPPAYNSYNQGCDPGWLGCSGWFPGFYPSVVYVRAPALRHGFPANPIRPGNPMRPHFGAPQAGQMSGRFGRG
jgi:hypothetical protein